MILNEKIYGISLEGKGAILFGILAFFISLLLGIIAGNKIGILFSRVLFFTVLYAVIGYVSLLIVKRLVPEIYEVLNNSFDFSNKNISQEDLVAVKTDEYTETKEKSSLKEENTLADGGYSEESFSKLSDATYNEAFTPFAAKDFTNLSSRDSKPKKMGKHIVMDDNKIQYEPKIMAEAIRTMLKRDKD